MTGYSPIGENSPDNWSVPGDTLRDWLDEHGMSQAALAKRLARPTKTVNEIIKGKTRITALTAIQLADVTGLPATFWVNRQAQYDLWLASRGEAIYKLRIEKRLTLREFCRSLNFDPSQWSKIERALLMPTRLQVEQAYKLLGRR